jgi:hypothetical protein
MQASISWIGIHPHNHDNSSVRVYDKNSELDYPKFKNLLRLNYLNEWI